MKKELEQAFNDHLNAELYSSYLYLAMANYFAAQNLDGMAKWMRVQADEERGHAMKFQDHINQRQGRVILKQIDQPKTDWTSPLEAFENAYNHEGEVTRRINGLVDLAGQHGDHAAGVFLQWFVNEQVEEEDTVLKIVHQLKMIGASVTGLFMIDHHLSGRS
jgi:ferritin